MNLIEARSGLELQIWIDWISDQQSTTFQHPDDTLTERVEKLGEIIVRGPTGAMETRITTTESVGPVQEQHVQVGVQVQGRAEALGHRARLPPPSA